MWPWFRGECDPSFCVGGAIVSEPRESFSRVFLRSNSHFKQRQGISSPSRVIFTCFSMFQQPFQATSRIFFTLESHFHVFFYVAIFFALESHFHVFSYAPRATSSNGKEFLHLRESSSRAFRRSNSHFKQLQGFASATFNAPYAPKSPLKVPQSPLNAPLSPGFTLKGSVTYWIERQCTICPQVPPKGSPVPPKCPLVPRFYPKRLSSILRKLWFRGECDPFWFRGECDPLLGANVTPVPCIMLWFCTTASSSSANTSGDQSLQWITNLGHPGALEKSRGTHVGTCVSDILWYSPILMAWICLNMLEYAWILCSKLFSLGSQNRCFFSTWTLWSFKSLCKKIPSPHGDSGKDRWRQSLEGKGCERSWKQPNDWWLHGGNWKISIDILWLMNVNDHYPYEKWLFHWEY